MEVTKSNFKEAFPIFKEAVEECDFLAIDTELTGLKTEGRREHAFDTMEERYCKILEISKQFLIIQFGVSCFKYHKDQNKYTHKDFNFYVFPRPHSRHAPDPIFICQSSSLLFLTKFGFDFNKLIHEGISYIRPHEEEKLRSSMRTRHDEETASKTPVKSTSKEQKNVHIPEDHKTFINFVHEQLNDFVKDDKQTVLRLPPCNGFQRKLIYQSVDQCALGVELSTSTTESKQSYILVEKANDEEKLKKLQAKQLADIEELDDAVGFRKIVDVISASRKLVIGHNMLLDIFHTVHQFFHPLPDNLRDFKELLKSIFPRLMDTKTLSSASVFKDSITSTSLSELILELKKKKYKGTIESAEEFQCYNADMEKNHEAGFDAFITGFCFIKLALVLKSRPDDNQDFISVDSSFLRPYINRPYIMQHFNVQSLNLHGPDPEAARDHVFYISFPKEWRTSDLIELFSPYGSIYISWLNDTSALIGLKSPEQSITVKKTLLKNMNAKYVVKTYADYKIMSSPSNYSPTNSTPPAESYTHKKRKAASDVSDAVAKRFVTTVPDDDCSSRKQENCVSTSLDEKSKFVSSEKPTIKKRKYIHEEEEANEVSSTEKLFQEPSAW